MSFAWKQRKIKLKKYLSGDIKLSTKIVKNMRFMESHGIEPVPENEWCPIHLQKRADVQGVAATTRGGNQRDLARQKNAKKSQEIGKKKGASDKEGNKGMSLEARKQRDAEQMRIKQQKAQNKDIEDGAASSSK